MNTLSFRPEIAFYVPGGGELNEAIARTTHVGIGAHQDDLEINMADGILRCYGDDSRGFFGIIASDGRGSPRSGPFAGLTDDEMVNVRRKEQCNAADIGRYTGVAFLPWRSAELKNGANSGPCEDLSALLEALAPKVVYTHNLMDKHDTHVAVALRTIEALRDLPPESRPKTLYGVEGWRDLDWLVDEHKVLFDCSEREALQRELVAAFQSQIAGGKRYDLAAIGRRQSHATGQQSHAVDAASAVSIGIDMTSLMNDSTMDAAQFATNEVRALEADVRARIEGLR